MNRVLLSVVIIGALTTPSPAQVSPHDDHDWPESHRDPI